MKFYYFLGFLLRPFAVLSLNFYSRATKTPRTRIILQNDRGQILLLQSWLSGSKWGLPGGGVAKNEDPASAAVRELNEETGIILPVETLLPIGSFRASGHEEIVFMASIEGILLDKVPNRFEIKTTQWFSLSELPSLEPLAAMIIDKVAKNL